MKLSGFTLVFGFALFGVAQSAHADAAADFARVVKDYQTAEAGLRPRRASLTNGDYLDRNGEELTSAYLEAAAEDRQRGAHRA